jgi:nucleotidyltransferase-like protein
MTDNEYLQEILGSQTLASDSAELKALQRQRAKVEKLLREHFAKSSPTIRYGGSTAKGTMIKEAYDLDLICYFANDDTAAGETLEEIYKNTKKALEAQYWVEEKPSALRLRDQDPKNFKADFHIDVVPGRYVDDTRSDVFLYQSSGDKKRLKTNLDVHIAHVRDSGVIDANRLLKLWRIRNGLRIKHFALELLTVKLLKEKMSATLTTQLKHVWEEFRDHSANLSIEDPANPKGNDLGPLLDTSVRNKLATVARATLENIEKSGWPAVFGTVEEKSKEAKVDSLRRAAASVTMPTKPWLPNA